MLFCLQRFWLHDQCIYFGEVDMQPVKATVSSTAYSPTMSHTDTDQGVICLKNLSTLGFWVASRIPGGRQNMTKQMSKIIIRYFSYSYIYIVIIIIIVYSLIYLFLYVV